MAGDTHRYSSSSNLGGERPGKIGRTTPHRPVTGWQIDEPQVGETGDFGEHRMSGVCQLRVLATGIAISVVSLAALAFTHPWPIATIAAYGLAGVALGLLITPQQVRLFTIDAPRATVALGLNGSAIHIAAMSAAAIGALVLTTAGPSWLVPTALAMAVLAGAVLWPLAPERWAQARGADTQPKNGATV